MRLTRNQNVQLTETAVLNATTINETRFQFSRNRNESLRQQHDSRAQRQFGAFGGCAGTQRCVFADRPCDERDEPVGS